MFLGRFTWVLHPGFGLGISVLGGHGFRIIGGRGAWLKLKRARREGRRARSAAAR